VLLRHVIEVGIEAGARYDNPARFIKASAARTTQLRLPEPDQFAAFVKEVESDGKGYCRHSANLVRFLAYGGFRKSEAANVTWADVDMTKESIHVRGDPETRTKNGEMRFIPMIPEMKALLQRLQAERPDRQPTDAVMTAKECQRSIDSACKRLGIPRFTHHGLRHMFMTQCIESDVDIPTASRWLGHKDGGALAMKTYGHLRDEHSAAMAKRMNWGASTTEPANVVPMAAKR